MAKINRRDYLIRMGAGAAGVIGAGRLNVCEGMSEVADVTAINPAQPTRAAKGTGTGFVSAKPHWPWTSVPPTDNPGIRLIFVGLIAFTYKGRDAEAIFHRAHEHHNLRIAIHEINGKVCSEVFNLGGGTKPIQIEEMELQVKGKGSNAAFYISGDPNVKLNRDSGPPKDFRWLLDLESESCYDRKLPRNKDKFRTRLRVRNGIFYTYQITNSRFIADGGTIKDPHIGHVAKVMAADIPLSQVECVSFKIDGNEVPYPICGTAKYEIYFFNDCPSCAGSDFPLVFDAVTINPGDRFDLKLDGSVGKDTPTDGLCITIPPARSRNTDEAPCMGAGLGFGGGFR